VTDQCVTGDALRTKAADLYASYRAWCEKAGEKPVSQRKLASLLQERGFTPDKDKHALLVWNRPGDAKQASDAW
jgi:phage/plasmid-associated DNA primase